MPLPESAAEHYRRLQRIQLVTITAAGALWARMGTEFEASWEALQPQLLALVVAAQGAAARSGAAYVPEVLTETGQPDEPLARTVLAAFTGTAADGRPLDSLLYGAVVQAKRARQGSVLTDGDVTRYVPGRSVTDALALGGRWLDGTVATVVADAGRQTVGAEIAQRSGMGWVRMINPPCCSRCAILAGRWYRWSDGFQRHKRCFPAGVVVSGPGHEAATRRWFQGELVVLSTASGQQLSLTGNHPVLTRRGWVPANLLSEGDEVVRSTGTEGARALVVPDHHEVPARIEDVWAALSVSGLRTVEATPEDFHGDGQHGQVDVVRADGAFHDGLFTAFGQQPTQEHLTVRSGTASALSDQCAAEVLDLGHPSAAGGTVGGGGLRLPLGIAHLGNARQPGIAGASARHTGSSQTLRDGTPAHAVLTSQSVLAGTGLVRGDDLLGGQLSGASRWDAPGGSFSVETAEGYTRLGRDLLDRLTSQVELDRVVDVRRVEWSGHVYSLTSVEGWHVANNLIVSNCDCVHIPALEDRAGDFRTDSQALLDRGLVSDLTRAQQQALADGADLGRVVNAQRGMYTTEIGGRRVTATTEATTTRGIGRDLGDLGKPPGQRYRRSRAVRLTPETIYRIADSREEAVRLLRVNGYLTG